MSYSRHIQVLIIEDEPSPKKFYDALFAQFPADAVAPPDYAFCLEDAEAALNSNAIYHLVILDLRLPEKPKQPPADGLEYGLAILRRCLNRDQYPIAALLIISGQLQKAANQTQLEESVRKGFAYGRVVTKGNGNEEEIKQAIENIQCYCAVGIHIRDSGEKMYPTLSPRDEDLLRRAVTAKNLCCGLDLRWWSAEFTTPTGRFAGFKGWNKTLMGRFLLAGGKGHSLPTFFKLFPAGGASQVHEEANLMQHKLHHIKVLGPPAISGDRSLLITEKVGHTEADPIPLDEFLAGESKEARSAMPQIVTDILNELTALGPATPNQVPLKDLLWRDHNEQQLREITSSSDLESPEDAVGVGPADVLARIRANDTIIRVDQRLCHGDLNVTNVALDRVGTTVRAYIFDASGMRKMVNVWDLAMLEVTALLHQPLDAGFGLVRHCSDAFKTIVISNEQLELKEGLPMVGNTLRLIAELRKRALEICDQKVYALMLFDHALIQVGGLTFWSANKIADPGEAILLARLTAKLLKSVAPEWLGT